MREWRSAQGPARSWLYELCGIDPSPACVENTRSWGIEAYPGTFSRPFPRSKIDCAVLSHTLEHVQDLNEATQWIGRVLAETGTVYVEVPDAVATLTTSMRLSGFQYRAYQHFSLLSLQRLMSRSGYRMVTGGEKLVATSKDTDYPAIFGFWRRPGRVPPCQICRGTKV